MHDRKSLVNTAYSEGGGGDVRNPDFEFLELHPLWKSFVFKRPPTDMIR
jgi:hypothetical protein